MAPLQKDPSKLWTPFKTMRDAVHGDISISEQELKIIDTRAFQRLRGIRQLGAVNLVYPSAVHTRFEHSIWHHAHGECDC